MLLIAIDPGSTESAFVVWDGESICHKGKEPNDAALQIVQDFGVNSFNRCAIEQVASYGMAVGAEVFETVRWAGRFEQAFGAERVDRIKRMEVKMHLCHRPTANDANIRQAIIDRFGGPSSIRSRQKAKPKKGTPETPAGALYGVSGDEWTALGVALAWWDKQEFSPGREMRA